MLDYGSSLYGYNANKTMLYYLMTFARSGFAISKIMIQTQSSR